MAREFHHHHMPGRQIKFWMGDKKLIETRCRGCNIVIGRKVVN